MVLNLQAAPSLLPADSTPSKGIASKAAKPFAGLPVSTGEKPGAPKPDRLRSTENTIGSGKEAAAAESATSPDFAALLGTIINASPRTESEAPAYPEIPDDKTKKSPLPALSGLTGQEEQPEADPSQGEAVLTPDTAEVNPLPFDAVFKQQYPEFAAEATGLSPALLSAASVLFGNFSAQHPSVLPVVENLNKTQQPLLALTLAGETSATNVSVTAARLKNAELQSQETVLGDATGLPSFRVPLSKNNAALPLAKDLLAPSPAMLADSNPLKNVVFQPDEILSVSVQTQLPSANIAKSILSEAAPLNLPVNNPAPAALQTPALSGVALDTPEQVQVSEAVLPVTPTTETRVPVASELTPAIIHADTDTRQGFAQQEQPSQTPAPKDPKIQASKSKAASASINTSLAGTQPADNTLNVGLNADIPAPIESFGTALNSAIQSANASASAQTRPLDTSSPLPITQQVSEQIAPLLQAAASGKDAPPELTGSMGQWQNQLVQKTQTVTVQLNPYNLGPVDVRLTRATGGSPAEAGSLKIQMMVNTPEAASQLQKDLGQLQHQLQGVLDQANPSPGKGGSAPIQLDAIQITLVSGAEKLADSGFGSLLNQQHSRSQEHQQALSSGEQETLFSQSPNSNGSHNGSGFQHQETSNRWLNAQTGQDPSSSGGQGYQRSGHSDRFPTSTTTDALSVNPLPGPETPPGTRNPQGRVSVLA